MTTPRTSNRPQRRDTPQRGQGQWALGYREPLNPNERMKKDADGLTVRQRVLDIYAHTGFGGIDPGDLRGRMMQQAIERQRLPGGPAEAGERALVLHHAGELVVGSGGLLGHGPRG